MPLLFAPAAERLAASPSQSLALALGVGALVMLGAARFRIPAILPLLAVGIVLGKQGLGMVDGGSLGSGLGALVTVSICLLIFEGCLHLDRRTLGAAPRAVWSVLTIGAMITWAGAALLARTTLGMNWGPSLILGAVLIVTGPTVVQPLLRRIPLSRRLTAVLSSEAILLDAVGAVMAISVLTVVLSLAAGSTATGLGATALLVGEAVGRLAAGGIIGAIAGAIGAFIVRRSAPASAETSVPLAAIGACMAAVGVAEFVDTEAGLAAATTAGMVIALSGLSRRGKLVHFTEHVVAFPLAALFILIASRIDLTAAMRAGGREAAFVAGLILLVRPAAAMISTLGSSLSLRERAFLCFFAPRGIVAASFAAYASLQLSSAGLASEPTIVTIVVLVILVTVVLATFTTRPMGRALGVLAGRPREVAIVGGHRLGRELGAALTREGAGVCIVDINPAHVADAEAAGLPALLGDATDAEWLDEQRFRDRFGWIVACTGNARIDGVISRWAVANLGPGRALMLVEPDDTGTPLPVGVDASLTRDRSLYGLLWDFERGRARVDVWEGQRPGCVPFAVVHPRAVRATPGAEAEPREVTILPAVDDGFVPPKGSRVVGLVYEGPMPGQTSAQAP